MRKKNNKKKTPVLNKDAQEHPLRRQLTAKAPELAPIFDKLGSETASLTLSDTLVLALVLNECTAGQSYRAPALGVLVSSPLTSVSVCVCARVFFVRVRRLPFQS